VTYQLQIDVPVAAPDVNAGENKLVWEVVYVNAYPANTFLLASQVNFVEDDDVDGVHNNGGNEQVPAE
jgi:hypothetical protein